MQADAKPSTDFLDLWQRSAPPKKEEKKVLAPLNEGRYLWTNLSQMAPADQAQIMSKLTGMWPYSTERRALNWPMHAGLLTNCITTSLIATKINSDMIAMNSRQGFFESVRSCPKAPFIFSIYTSGVAFFILQQTMINPLVYREDDPCGSCLFSRSFAIGAATGIIMPMLATPYLCHYVLTQRQNEKLPEIKNTLEFLTLSIEGSRAARPLIAWLLILQAGVAAVSIYSVLWARKRVFGTMDADPELAKELLIQVQSKEGFKDKLVNYLRKIPLLGGSVAPPAPEKEII